jgi:hypothetical protein
MEELTLNPEALRVQSFAASAAGLPNVERTRPHVCDPVTARCCPIAEDRDRESPDR